MKRIIFVYNAQSDSWSKSLDFAHKIISPSTYNCSLCSLTHGSFSERKKWKIFRETTSHTLIFEYKNEFLKRLENNHNHIFHFPVVVEENQGNYDILISSDELNRIESLDELIEKMKNKMG